MDEAYQAILAWLDREFPSADYPAEHWSKDDASAYLPAGSSVPPELAHEAGIQFAYKLMRSPHRLHLVT